jgi:hypothetical protein
MPDERTCEVGKALVVSPVRHTVDRCADLISLSMSSSSTA